MRYGVIEGMDEQNGRLLFFWKTYKIPLILGGSSFLLISLSLFLLVKSTQTSTPIEFLQEASVSGMSTGTITIDIEGTVVRPGLYTLPIGSRVEEAIGLAGGLTADADTDRIEKTINRAARLADGAKLYFPRIGENMSLPTQSNVSASQTQGNPIGPLISVNAASQRDLESLPGIGPVTAEKIINNRPYQTFEELVTKKVMSRSLFTKLIDQLSL